jgi:hypothetical protein
VQAYPKRSPDEPQSFHMEPTPCYQCGAVVNAATDPDQERAPKPEDLSMCLHCGALGIYVLVPSGLLTIRRPTYEEFTEIAKDPDIRKAVMARALAMGNRDKPGLS